MWICLNPIWSGFPVKDFQKVNWARLLQTVYEIKLNGLEYLFKTEMKIYTAQYKYTGDDRLDITVKGKDPIGRFFCAHLENGHGIKEGIIPWDEYKQMYRKLMQKSYRENLGAWNDILGRMR